MLAEIQGIHILLMRWSKNPDAPASEISPFTADRDENRPFTREEIASVAVFMRKHAPRSLDLTFFDDRNDSSDPAVFGSAGFSGDVSTSEPRTRHTGASGAPAD